MMKRNSKFCAVLIFLLLTGVFTANAQKLVESIAAIVGNEVIYLSDVENAITDYRRSGNKTPEDQMTCSVFHEIVSQLPMMLLREILTCGLMMQSGEPEVKKHLSLFSRRV